MASLLSEIQRIFGKGNSLVYALNGTHILLVLPKGGNPAVQRALKSAFIETFENGKFFSGGDYPEFSAGAIVIFVSAIQDFMALVPADSERVFWATVGRGAPTVKTVLFTHKDVEAAKNAQSPTPDTGRTIN